MDRQRIRKNDLYLIGALLLLALACLLLVQLRKTDGAQVTVYAGGEKQGSYPLDLDQTVTIRAGGGSNVLVIEDGSAYLTEADCPDKLCVLMGRIRYDGQTIVCLPHKVVIAVEGKAGEDTPGSEGEEIDAVAR